MTEENKFKEAGLKYLTTFEGNINKFYFPNSASSGATIGMGIDVAKKTEKELENLEFPKEIINQLKKHKLIRHESNGKTVDGLKGNAVKEVLEKKEIKLESEQLKNVNREIWNHSLETAKKDIGKDEWEKLSDTAKHIAIDITHNVGSITEESAPKLLKALRKNDIKEIANQMLDIVNVTQDGKKVISKGLLQRRIYLHNILAKEHKDVSVINDYRLTEENGKINVSLYSGESEILKFTSDGIARESIFKVNGESHSEEYSIWANKKNEVFTETEADKIAENLLPDIDMTGQYDITKEDLIPIEENIQKYVSKQNTEELKETVAQTIGVPEEVIPDDIVEDTTTAIAQVIDEENIDEETIPKALLDTIIPEAVAEDKIETDQKFSASIDPYEQIAKSLQEAQEQELAKKELYADYAKKYAYPDAYTFQSEEAKQHLWERQVKERDEIEPVRTPVSQEYKEMILEQASKKELPIQKQIEKAKQVRKYKDTTMQEQMALSNMPAERKPIKEDSKPSLLPSKEPADLIMEKLIQEYPDSENDFLQLRTAWREAYMKQHNIKTKIPDITTPDTGEYVYGEPSI